MRLCIPGLAKLNQATLNHQFLRDEYPCHWHRQCKFGQYLLTYPARQQAGRAGHPASIWATRSRATPLRAAIPGHPVPIEMRCGWPLLSARDERQRRIGPRLWFSAPARQLADRGGAPHWIYSRIFSHAIPGHPKASLLSSQILPIRGLVLRRSRSARAPASYPLAFGHPAEASPQPGHEPNDQKQKPPGEKNLTGRHNSPSQDA